MYDNFARTAVDEVAAGDICALTGLAGVSIGETICDPSDVRPLPTIEARGWRRGPRGGRGRGGRGCRGSLRLGGCAPVLAAWLAKRAPASRLASVLLYLQQVEEPTVRMTFSVNTSPFAGQEGKYVTSRNLKARRCMCWAAAGLLRACCWPAAGPLRALLLALLLGWARALLRGWAGHASRPRPPLLAARQTVAPLAPPAGPPGARAGAQPGAARGARRGRRVL